MASHGFIIWPYVFFSSDSAELDIRECDGLTGSPGKSQKED
jgi:hypothetical protein